MNVLYLTAMCLSGVALWSWLARQGLQPLRDEETSHHGFAIFLAMMLVANVGAIAVQAAVGGAAGLEDAQLPDLLAIQSSTYILAIVAVLAVARRCGVTFRSLGLRRSGGPPAAALAVAGWLACYPLFLLAAALNHTVMPPDSEVLQDSLLRFMNEPGAAADPIVWLSIVVVLPIAEEIIFRGALYGSLRWMVPPWLAMGLAGILFGALHDGASLLPTATLGVLFAWLYERTGSLTVPCLAHGLHNGLTLTMIIILPETTS